MRKFMFARLIAGLLAMSIIVPAHGQTPLNIYVSSSGEDSVGQRLVYSIKQHLRKDPTVAVTDSPKGASLVLHVMTMDPNVDAPGSSGLTNRLTAYSALWLIPHPGALDSLIYNDFGVCGTGKIYECSETIAARTDKYASEVRATRNAR